MGQIIETTVGNIVGEKLGDTAVKAFIEYGDPERIVEQVRTLTDREELDRIATEITDESTDN